MILQPTNQRLLLSLERSFVNYLIMESPGEVVFVGQNKKVTQLCSILRVFNSGTLPKMMSCMASQSKSKKECHPKKPA